MPAYNPLLTPPYTDLRLGEQIALWSAESPAAGTNSIVVTCGYDPSSNLGITFQVNFATAPTASVTILGSNFAPTTAPQNGIVLATITTQNASYTDNNAFMFYWSQVVSVSAGLPLTLIAQR